MKSSRKLSQNPAPWLRILTLASFLPLVFAIAIFGTHYGLLEASPEICSLLPYLLFLLYLCVGLPARKNRFLLPLSYAFFALVHFSVAIYFLRTIVITGYGIRFFLRHMPYIPLQICADFVIGGINVALAALSATGFKHTKAAQILIGVWAAMTLPHHWRIFYFIFWRPNYLFDSLPDFLSLFSTLILLAGQFLFWRHSAPLPPAQPPQQE